MYRPSKHLLVLKTSRRRLQDMSWRRLQHVFSVAILRLPRRLEDVIARRLKDLLKTYGQDDILVFKTSSEEVWLIRIYSSSSRRMFAGTCSLCIASCQVVPKHDETLTFCYIYASTIIFKIFWDFLMFYQISLSPQVKRCAIITYKPAGFLSVPHWWNSLNENWQDESFVLVLVVSLGCFYRMLLLRKECFVCQR